MTLEALYLRAPGGSLGRGLGFSSESWSASDVPGQVRPPPMHLEVSSRKPSQELQGAKEMEICRPRGKETVI